MLRFSGFSGKKKKLTNHTACTPTFPCFGLLCSHSFPDDENECARSGAGQGMQSKEMTTWNKSSGAAETAEKWHMTPPTPFGVTPGISSNVTAMRCNLSFCECAISRATLQEQHQSHVMLNELSRLLLLSSFSHIHHPPPGEGQVIWTGLILG